MRRMNFLTNSRTLAFTFLAVAALAVSACGAQFDFEFNLDDVEGSGVVETRTFDLAEFDRIDLSSGFEGEITIDPDADSTVSIEMDDNFFEFVDVEIRNSTLVIDPKNVWFRSDNPRRVTVTMPSLESLDLSGGSEATITDLDQASFFADLSGGSEVTVSGTVADLEIDGSGGSLFFMEQLTAARTKASLSGGSELETTTTERLSGAASGGSTIDLWGGASSSAALSGGSEVRPR